MQGKTPGHDCWANCWVRVSVVLGMGPGGWRWGLRPQVLCVSLSWEGDGS